MGKGTEPELEWVELDRLRRENAELRRRLAEVEAGDARAALTDPPDHPKSCLDTKGKLAVFRSLFAGRGDVYPLRWENKAGKSGYAPACANEWKPGICEKPKVKCSECGNKAFLAVTDQAAFDHLSGRQTMGVYPLLANDSCHFLALDFDDAEWRADVAAFRRSCDDLGVPAHVEISRSGKGAHVWIFFSSAVSAALARQLGTAVLTHTCAHARQLKLSSYDRMFPSQDTVPRGGFGNLIALPLQKRSRELDRSVFVDNEFRPYADQWTYLAGAARFEPDSALEVINRVAADGNLLDVGFVEDEEGSPPWRSTAKTRPHLPQPLPKVLAITLADKIYFEKAELPDALLNRLIRIAAFRNPEFYAAQSMRMSVWNKPRVIGCAENLPRHVALPRGCLDEVLELLRANGVRPQIYDERANGSGITARFSGSLREDQANAVAVMLRHDVGVLCAPTAFGKTVAAAAVIAERAVNTLVLVHRTELLNQWRERLLSFLDVDLSAVGMIGGGKQKACGMVDVAVMQSLVRRGEVKDLVEHYGQVIVDECHHVSAVSFEQILKRVKARYVLGLTATPVRRDGHHPIVIMQCGPIRHRVVRSATVPPIMEVVPRHVSAPGLIEGEAIQSLFGRISLDERRNEWIAADVGAAYASGRHVVVMSERTEHVERLAQSLARVTPNLFVLHGRMGKRQRQEVLERLNALGSGEPRVLVATGKLIGEGFDHARLDTLVLAMPISWKGTLQQYAGRLHRDHVDKSSVVIYDYVEADHPQLARMWEKRRRGYRAMGYEVRPFAAHSS